MLGAVLALLGLAGQVAPQSPCSQPIGQSSSAAVELCLGEQEARLADAASKQPTEQSRHWQLALEHYRRAVDWTPNTDIKKRSLLALADLFGPKRLNDLSQAQGALQELLTLEPNDVEPLFRLSQVFEQFGLFDAAEEKLLLARRQAPEGIEPYKMLAQFYARRATAMHRLAESQTPAERRNGPGERDDQGVYRIGGPIEPPHRMDNPIYPPEALAAGIDGVVGAEIVVNEAGNVTDVKIIRSVPLLDEAAIKAVRNWRYDPTIVNGKAVPVRVAVTVNFTKR